MKEQLLVVLVASTLKEDLIDALIQCPHITGFSLQEISGYSREHSQYDLSEQVAGYRKLHRFEVQHEAALERVLLKLLEEVCSASHARYWIVPVQTSGVVGQAQ